MNILLIIAYSLLAALAVWAAYWFFKDPGHFLLLDNKYRMMVRIRECDLKGQKAQPQDSEGYFLRKATKIINDYKPVFGPIEIKADLQFHKETVANMLSRREYYQYYFTQGRSNLQWFHQMYVDYRSGDYETYPYGRANQLRAVLPERMPANKTLIDGLLKLIDVGWLDETGKPMPEIRKQQLSLAASILCDYAGVKNYDDLFGSFWGIKPSTMRSNKRHALESVDGASMLMEIEGIMGLSHKI